MSLRCGNLLDLSLENLICEGRRVGDLAFFVAACFLGYFTCGLNSFIVHITVRTVTTSYNLIVAVAPGVAVFIKYSRVRCIAGNSRKSFICCINHIRVCPTVELVGASGRFGLGRRFAGVTRNCIVINSSGSDYVSVAVDPSYRVRYRRPNRDKINVFRGYRIKVIYRTVAKLPFICITCLFGLRIYEFFAFLNALFLGIGRSAVRIKRCNIAFLYDERSVAVGIKCNIACGGKARMFAFRLVVLRVEADERAACDLNA